MHKFDLASCVAHRIGVNRSPAGDSMDAVFEAVGEALSTRERVRIVGFGTASRVTHARHSPGPGVSMGVPASTAPMFSPSKPSKDAVKGGTHLDPESPIYDDRKGWEGSRC